ncbi:hypothetical protein [Pseudomonas viridiflava]|uniref:hypothetical protein n=1 Tax=Pseudomonas viridiflava TaxID=33069 RepID=UPI0013C2AA2D|nr:hypothetical protein [Pseudomonas viridiflava]
MERLQNTGPIVGSAVSEASPKVPAPSGKALDWKSVVFLKGKYKGEVRENHVRLHNFNDTAKPLNGVFNGDAVNLTSEAWQKAQANGIKPTPMVH